MKTHSKAHLAHGSKFADPYFRSSEEKRMTRNISRSHYRRSAMGTAPSSEVKGHSGTTGINAVQ